MWNSIIDVFNEKTKDENESVKTENVDSKTE